MSCKLYFRNFISSSMRSFWVSAGRKEMMMKKTHLHTSPLHFIHYWREWRSILNVGMKKSGTRELGNWGTGEPTWLHSYNIPLAILQISTIKLETKLVNRMIEYLQLLPFPVWWKFSGKCTRRNEQKEIFLLIHLWNNVMMRMMRNVTQNILIMSNLF